MDQNSKAGLIPGAGDLVGTIGDASMASSSGLIVSSGPSSNQALIGQAQSRRIQAGSVGGSGNALNPFGLSMQTVVLPEGTVSVDEFIEERKRVNEWVKIKGILDAHQIIEDWPDGDIVIRIKRKKADHITMTGQTAKPSDFKVEFGVDEE